MTTNTKYLLENTTTGSATWVIGPDASAGSFSGTAIASGLVGVTYGGTGLNASATGGSNQFVKQSGSGSAFTVGTIATADIATALTTPGAIGGTTPSTGAFTTLKMTTGAGAGLVLQSDGSGNATWGSVSAVQAMKQPVRVVVTTNTTISAPGTTLDGVSMAAGDRVLLTGQSTASQNGIWTWNSSGGAMTRPADYPAASTTAAFYGVAVDVLAGTVGAGSMYFISTTGAITIDTTSVTFTIMTLNVPSTVIGKVPLANGGTNADLSATGAANSFLKQSSSGAAVTVGTIASADINTALTTPGPIGGTTPGVVNATNLSATGHLQAKGTAPTFSIDVSDGAANLTSVTGSGSDMAGQITVVTAASSVPVVFAKVVFAAAYTSTPFVMLTPANGNAALNPYLFSSSNSQFVMGCTSSPGNSETLVFNYLVIANGS